METAIVCAHTKAASTCYRLDPPGSNFLGSLFCTALTGYVIMLSAIYRVFLFLSCLLSFVDTHRRLDSPCVMRVYVFNSLSIVKVGYRLTHAQGDPALIRGGGARNRGTWNNGFKKYEDRSPKNSRYSPRQKQKSTLENQGKS